MRFFGIKPAKAERQAKHKAAQRGHGNAKGGKPRSIMPRDGGLQGGEAFRGLRYGHQTLGDPQRRIQRERGPVKQRLPCFRLAGGEAMILGPVAEQIRLAKPGDAHHHGVRVRRDAFLGRAQKPGQGHVFRVHLPALGPAGLLPFIGNRLGQRAALCGQNTATWQAQRPPIQHNAIAAFQAWHGQGRFPKTLHEMQFSATEGKEKPCPMGRHSSLLIRLDAGHAPALVTRPS